MTPRKRHRSGDTRGRSQRGKLQASRSAPRPAVLSVPPGVFVSVLSYLTAQDLLRCMLVCRWWKQQIYAPSTVSLQNPVFRWHSYYTRLGLPLQPLSLPHIQRLHAKLSIMGQNGDDEFTERSTEAMQFILREVNTHCQQLTELMLWTSVSVTLPAQLELPSTLQVLTLSDFIRVDHHHISSIGASWPHLKSLKLFQHRCTGLEPAALCRIIGQSLRQLETLVLPDCSPQCTIDNHHHVFDTETYFTDRHMFDLAPLTRLRHLSLELYYDAVFTFQKSWQLESLQLACDRPSHDGHPPMVLQGAAPTLKTLVLWLFSARDQDSVLRSLVRSGCAATLQNLSWRAGSPKGRRTVEYFSQFKALKTLSMQPDNTDGQQLCAILRGLQCSLEHIQLPLNWTYTGHAIQNLLYALSEAAAVRQCRVVGLPWNGDVNVKVLLQLLTRLPRLTKLHLSIFSHDLDRTSTDRSVASINRSIEVCWSEGCTPTIPLGVADEAFWLGKC